MIRTSFQNVAAIGQAGLPPTGPSPASTMKRYNFTSTSVTLTNGMDGGLLVINNASAITVTVPSTLNKDFYLTVLQLGAGAITFSAGSGATLQSLSGGLTTAGIYALAAIVKVNSAGLFVIGGDVT